MHCRDITDLAFEAIQGELTNVERKAGAIESVCGMHNQFGATVLLRDASRCMALVADPVGLDRTLAELAFTSGCPGGIERIRSGRH